MYDSLSPSLLRRFIFGLICSLVAAFSTLTLPIQAHTGISEEIEEITRQIQVEPEATDLYLLRGDLHRINGHWPEAIADFHKVQQLDPGNAAADLGLGRTYLDQGLYRKAIKHLDRTLAKQADNVRGLVTRAKAYRLLGKPLAAAADYHRAINAFQAPKNPIPDYYFERARAFEAAGINYLDAAIETLDAGISRLGELWILEDYAVELERKRSNTAVALQRLDRLISRTGRKEALLVRRGEILLQANRPAEAENNFTAARAAMLALPPQRRHTRAMKRLQADVDRKIHSLKQNASGK